MIFMKDLYIPIFILAGLLGVFLLISNKKAEAPIIKSENIVENNKTQMREINTIEGLKIKVLQEGTGAEAVAGKQVSVHYTGKLVDGTVFDSSIPRGQAFTFALGAGQVIRGWDLGVAGMKIGEKRELTISSDLAYGDRGITADNGVAIIPSKATLIFEVELLAVK